MPNKPTIAFPVTVTKEDLDERLGGWRCPSLKIPGARVEDLLVLGNRVNSSHFVVDHELGIVRWAGPEPTPEGATIIIKLTEELSTKELTLRWKKLAIIIPIITVVLAGIFSYQFRRPEQIDNPPLPYLPSTCEKNVRISVPVDMQHISLNEDIKGTYKDLPPGHKIWIMVYPPTIRRFYPQGEAALTHNTWSVKAHTGLMQEAGRTFEIYAVLVNESAHNALNFYAVRASETNVSPGMPDLPEGAVICQRIQVTRQ
ncbi:MAG: hypothetical protein H7Z16_08365 [Pyrinomonadaceae bacterium]|nr:hypothetical protein [Pyrinomonadaceae bacterium]